MSGITYHGKPAHYLGPSRYDDGRTAGPHTRTVGGKVRGYPGRSAIIPTCWCHGGRILDIRNDCITVTA